MGHFRGSKFIAAPCLCQLNLLELVANQQSIDGLQPIPRDTINEGMATMLVEQTKEVLEKSFVYVHQHGGDDIM